MWGGPDRRYVGRVYRLDCAVRLILSSLGGGLLWVNDQLKQRFRITWALFGN
jgi:hypothetical protein